MLVAVEQGNEVGLRDQDVAAPGVFLVDDEYGELLLPGGLVLHVSHDGEDGDALAVLDFDVEHRVDDVG